MKTAYIQSVGGASGDMLLGALLDAGLPISAIHDAIAALKIPGVEITQEDQIRCEVRGTRALVDVSNTPRYSPQQMLDAVANATALSSQTRTRSTNVLNALFTAESRVHGSNPGQSHPHEPGATDTPVRDYLDQIHLHELGTADTLVDVVGVVHGLEQLGIDRIYASPLVLGEATGPRRPNGYSNPAPATLEIIAAAKAPVAPERPFHANVGELTTPTGAALITTLTDEYRQPAMTLHRIGVGVGGKNPPAFPNVIRLWLGQTIPLTTNAQPNSPVIASEAQQSRPLIRHPDSLSRHSDIPSRHSGESRNPEPSRPAHSEPERSPLSAHGDPVEPRADDNPQPAAHPEPVEPRADDNPQPAAHPEPVEPRADDNPQPSAHPEPVEGQPFARWQDNIILLETNIDNATGEQLGYAMEQLFNAGALDVWHTPIQMKKNRPAILLSALAPAELETQLAEAILRYTPTLGVRVRPITRYVAHRDTITVDTEFGPIRLKRKYLSGQIVSQSPEHDDIANAAQTHNLPWQTIAAAVPSIELDAQ